MAEGILWNRTRHDQPQGTSHSQSTLTKTDMDFKNSHRYLVGRKPRRSSWEWTPATANVTTVENELTTPESTLPIPLDELIDTQTPRSPKVRTVEFEYPIDDWKTDIAKPTATLYALLMIISNVALSIASQTRRDNHIPRTYSKCFDAVLYILSILYLLYTMLFLFRGNRNPESDFDRNPSAGRERTKSSVYLKINAIICGIGAMIFSCLEFGVWVTSGSCNDNMAGVLPLLLVTYVAMQTYFIFLHSKRVITRHTLLSRFGLMHLVATDITLWLRVLIDQTLYEFSVYRTLEQGSNSTVFVVPTISGNVALGGPRLDNDNRFESYEALLSQNATNDSKFVEGYRGIQLQGCLHQESILGEVLIKSSVFLYPCIIGYAVISAGIIYVMCRNICATASDVSENTKENSPLTKADNRQQIPCTCKSHPPAPRLYWLDCDQAVGGLLTGAVVLALTVVCLILFFVFKTRDPELAMLDGQLGEIVLYALGIGAVCIALAQAQKLPKTVVKNAPWQLDSAMLLVSVMGVYAFSVLSIIGSNDDEPGTPTNTILMITAQSLAIVQATLQTVYIFEASYRCIPELGESTHKRDWTNSAKVDKPGRNVLTFLIVINLAFWNFNIFKTLRSEASPTQRDFFGVYEWTIITHVTVPLTLLYRFHSAASLFEIWKHAYKTRTRDLNRRHAPHCCNSDFVTSEPRF